MRRGHIQHHVFLACYEASAPHNMSLEHVRTKLNSCFLACSDASAPHNISLEHVKTKLKEFLESRHVRKTLCRLTGCAALVRRFNRLLFSVRQFCTEESTKRILNSFTEMDCSMKAQGLLDCDPKLGILMISLGSPLLSIVLVHAFEKSA